MPTTQSPTYSSWCPLLPFVAGDTCDMLTKLSAVPLQVDVQLLADPWQSLEHATQAQLADPKLEAAVKVAVKTLHVINKYRHGDIQKPNLMFR